MNLLIEFIDSINKRIGDSLRWLVLILVLIASYNAIARFLSKPLGMNLSSNSLIEIQWYLFSVVFLLGAPALLQMNGHVRVDIFYANRSHKTKAIINGLGAILLLIPFCIMTWNACYPTVINSWKIMEMSPDPGGLPRYPIKSLLLLSFALLGLQGVSEFCKSIQVLSGKRDY